MKGGPVIKGSVVINEAVSAQTKLSAPSGEVQALGTDGGVQITKHSNTGIDDGRMVVASAGTAETLTASSTPCTKVNIMAEKNNTGIICVGGSSVVAAEATRTGIPLDAGQSHTIEIDDLVKIYLDTTVSTDGVTYNYFTEA